MRYVITAALNQEGAKAHSRDAKAVITPRLTLIVHVTYNLFKITKVLKNFIAASRINVFTNQRLHFIEKRVYK